MLELHGHLHVFCWFKYCFVDNFRGLTSRYHRQLMIQGNYDDVDEKWKDDSGITLLFSQFVDDKYTPKGVKHKLYLEQTDSPENFLMLSRRGIVHPAITLCTIWYFRFLLIWTLFGINLYASFIDLYLNVTVSIQNSFILI